jgi:3',5'-cyclic AMP phosphodiesterase CpdA
VGTAMAHYIDEGKREKRQVHALHLGDVYYSGWKEEYRSRFLPFWPVRSVSEGVASWALNGNHDMYSGGHGYFGYLLSDPRFAGQARSSRFCLRNDHWQLLGLDTAYEDDDLAGDQGSWVADKQRASRRKTMLLTHHQPFSAFEEVDPPFLKKLAPAFAVRGIDAWLWGHEHMCCVYDSNLRDYLGFGSCIGHGGVPVLLWEGKTPAGVRWRFTESEVHEGADRWQRFGFAVLDFKDERIEIQYRDQDGRVLETFTVE